MDSKALNTAASDTAAGTEPSKRAVSYLRVSTADQAHGADAAEGYSIPAQRQACERKARDLGATVVAEFSDRGESARSAARPELQRMLKQLTEHKDVDYVIVHKIDRLARNRADDIEIQLAIQGAGAQLVSVTESVDATPSGQLLHAIMAGIAEFYSANLATEILKGSTQKALMGGTPYKAPPGYVNVRQMVLGREVRTVEIDPEQAPLVRQAFELYATGDYSLRALHRLLTAAGLVNRPTAKRPGGPLVLSQIAKLLRNRYYLGVVPYRGVEHPGKHPALIGAELFERVQQVLDERDQHSIKTRRHQHYLRGLLNCARCRSRMQYMTVRNRHGNEFDYYVCRRRHSGEGCDLPYLAAFEVEKRIERAWPLWVRLDELDAISVGEQLHELIVGKQDNGARLARAQRTLARLDTERRKLVQMAYADAIPLDLLKSEQARIAQERAQAEREADQAAADGQDVMATYNQARDLMQRGASVYVMGGPEVRRLLNRAFIARIEVDVEDEDAVLASPWREIRDAAAYVRANDCTAELSPAPGRPKATGRSSKANPGLISEVRGSNMTALVDLTGQLSNLCPPLERMLAKRKSQVSRTKTASGSARQRQKHVRLSDAQQAELVQRHRDGAFKKELARAYGVHVETVRAIIRRHQLGPGMVRI